MDLATKFWIVNRTLFAINLGLCGLETNVAYIILKFEKVGRNRISLLLFKIIPRYSTRFLRDTLTLFRTGALIKLIQGRKNIK